MARVGMDVNEVELSVMSSLEMIFRDPITIIVFLISLFVMSYQLTLFALVLLPFSGFIIGRIGKNLRKESRKLQSQQGTLLSILEETLSGMRIVKAFNGERKITRKFEKVNQEFTSTITKVYRLRWQIELFFKWVKQHLRIKRFFGTSENAVKTQIWIAVTVYVLIAIIRKRLGLELSLYRILQILSFTLFEKTPINQLLTESTYSSAQRDMSNQLELFDL